MKRAGPLMILVLAAQAIAQQPRAFEVVSIKPSAPLTPENMRSGELHLGTKIDNARADFGSVSLTTLIGRAYQLRAFQVSGPEWMNATRFDILGKLPQGTTAEQVPEMLQTLLKERFKLTFHQDSKEFPIYAMVVGKDGLKLVPRPADYDPTATNKEMPMTLDAVASLVSGSFEKPVIDQTGLKGLYMVAQMDLMRDQTKAAMDRLRSNVAARNGTAPGDTAAEPAGASTIGLLQAMGLKLESRKAPMPVFVIDHIEKTPAEN